MTRERFNDIELLDEWTVRHRRSSGVGQVLACDVYTRAEAQDTTVGVLQQDIFTRVVAQDYVGPPC